MGALDTLRKLNQHPAVLIANVHVARLKRAARPIAPTLTRLLVASTFVEDSIRTLFEMKKQMIFFSRALGIPYKTSVLIILLAIFLTLVSVALFLLPPTAAFGAKALLLCVAYQQLVYGRHSAITTGNLGFFVRNACMAGTLALFLTVPKHAPEPSLPGMSVKLRKSARDNAALLVRILFAFACLEMFDVIGYLWSLLIIPAAVALVIGYQVELCAILLLVFYAVGAAVANPFWSINITSDELLEMRHLMRYEFLQTISILGGLLLVIMSGPGAFSVDSKLREGKAW